MPSPERNWLKDYAVYWPTTGDNDYGDPKFSDPIQIRCRWDSTVSDPPAALVSSEQDSSLIGVDRDVTIGGLLWLGKLRDLPDEPLGLRQIMKFTKTPNLKRRRYMRTATVTTFAKKIPQEQRG